MRTLIRKKNKMKPSKVFLPLALLLASLNLQAQAVYDSLTAAAGDQYRQKQYCKAAELYQEAFLSNNDRGKLDDRIAAAGCWVLCGRFDSAFSQLYRVVTRAKYTDAYALLSDEDLKPLYNDKRWDQLIRDVWENKRAAFAKLKYPPVAAMLDSMFTADQQHRAEIQKIQMSEGPKDSVLVNALWKKMARNDSLNLQVVEGLIKQYGWLGKEDVGERGVLTMFLVIHHSEHPEVQRKYLPVLRQAANEGKLEKRHLALLEDRVLVDLGKKQLYGTQIGTDPKTGKFIVLPIEDEPNVNKRRAEVGLDPLEVYARNWGIDYVLPGK